MSKEKVLFLREILITQMNHWVLFMIGVTVMGVIQTDPPVMWRWAAYSLVPLLLFLVRRYSDHFVLFMGSHLLVAAGMFLLSGEAFVEKIMLLLCVVYYLCLSFYLRVKSEDRLDNAWNPMAAVIIGGICTLLQHYQGIQEWESYYIAPVVVFLGMYFVQMYLDQYLNFMVVNNSNKGRIPEKAMFRSGISLVTMFSMGAIVILFMASGVGWFGQITAWLKAVLIWLLRLLFSGKGAVEEEEIIAEQEQTPVQRDEFMPVEDAEPSLFWVIMEKVLMVAMAIALVALCIFVIYKLITFLRDKFNLSLKKEAAQIEDEVNDVREKCEVERKAKEKRAPFEFLSTRERIRRLYRKEVWAQRMQLVTDGSPSFLKLLTAKECGQKMERAPLAQSYDKARYSDQECTAEDVRKAKERS